MKPAQTQTDRKQARILKLAGELRAIEKELEELTGGQIDAVLGPAGDAFLLSGAQAKLRESDAVNRLFAETRAAILNALPARIALLDAKGVIVAVNERWEHGDDARIESVRAGVGDNYIESCGRDPAPGVCAFAAGIRDVLEDRAKEFLSGYALGLPGERRWFELSATQLQSGSLAGAVVMHLDVSERRESERRLARLSRLYLMLSRTNETIVQARSRDSLLSGLCRLAVEVGKFRMVAVVAADHKRGRIRPVTFAGDETGYFAEIGDSVDHDPAHAGLFGRIVSNEQPLVCNNIADEALTEIVRSASKKRGYCSMASLPVSVGGRHEGALLFMSDEPGYFEDDEVSLLTGMANDLSFTLEALENEEKRTRAEAELAAAERRLAVILGSAGEGIHGLDQDGNVIFANPAAAAMFGREPDEMIGKHSHALIHHHRADGSVYPVGKCPIYKTLRDGVTRSVRDEVFFRKDGSHFPVEYMCAPMRDESGAIVGVVVNFRDVSHQVEAEEALQASREQFSSAFEHASIGIALVSPDGNFLRVNRSLCLMLGRTAEELLEADFQTLTHPDDLKSDLEHVRRLLAGETDFYEMEKRYFHKDGHIVWAFLSVSLVRDAAGRPLHFVSQVQDISVRRRVEEERDRLFNLSVDMLGVASFDGHFEQVNPAWTECLGWSAAEITSRPWLEFVHPDDVAITEGAAALLMRGETLRNFENRYRCKDGTYRWISWSCHPLLETRQIFTVSRDVTERREKEEKLLLLQNCVARLNDGVLITEGYPLTEPHPRIIFANPAIEAITGYRPDELIGRSPRCLQGPGTEGSALERIRKSLQEAKPVSAELINYRKDGTPYWIEVSISPVFNANGETTHFVAVQRDVTGRKNAEEERSRSQALLRVAGETARLGGWSLSLPDQAITWTEETAAIHDKPSGFSPSLDEALGFFREEDRAHVTQMLRRCMEAGEPFDFEAGIITSTGREVTVRSIGEAVYSGDGRIIRLQGAFQDITPQKDLERSLRASEERFRELAEAMPMIVWSSLPDGSVDYSNHHFFEFTGASQNEPPATRWQRFLHPDDLPYCLQTWESSIRRAVPFDIEYRIRRASDGVYRWFRVQALPVRDAEGIVTKWYGTALDIHETKRIQEEATQIAARLATTLESITDAFITLDRTFRVTYLNAEAERVLERDRARLLGSNVWDVFPEAVGSRFEREYRRAIDQNITVAFEEYFAPLDRWFEVRAYPSSEGLAIYFQDISDAHRHNEALRESEERFRLLAKATNDAIWEWDIQNDKVEWNDGFERLFGHQREGSDPTSLSWTSHIHPGDFDRVQRDLRRVLDGEGLEWQNEYRFGRHDGTFAYVIDRGYIIRDADGRAVRMVAGLSDQTERKAAEERIAEQAALLDIAHESILVKDLEDRIIFWNKGAERTFGWTSAEVLGRKASEFLYSDTPGLRAAQEAVLSKGEWQGELRGRSKRGSELSIEATWTFVRDSGGKPKSVLMIGSDITERKRLEQQFLRAQRMESIGTLAGGIAHDLNNLLSPILMGVGLLKMSGPGPANDAVIETIEQSARRGTDLVKQVLSFARGVEGARIAASVDHIVGEIEGIVVNTFPKNITFERRAAPGLWPVFCDPTQLNQVFLNLCVNARDAMPDGGTLRVDVRNVVVDQEILLESDEARPGPHVLIAISDSGCGMPAGILDRVFEPFFTTKELGQGTGLGLSTVLGIIRSHGGFVNVTSELGAGTTFRIYLPAETDQSPAEPIEAPPALPRGGGETVLVVDDEDSILEITRQTLEAFGYRVLVADDGTKAVALFARHRAEIAVVLTDMMMPGMDGTALVSALRRIDPDVKIIASSGLSTPGDAEDAGIDHFLEKPYSTRTLLVLLKELIGGKNRTPG